MYNLKEFFGPNAGYVLELYDRYRQNPASVDAATRAIFDTWSPDSQLTLKQGSPTEAAPLPVSKIVAASFLAQAIRSRGHLGAHLDPLGSEPLGDPALLTETHGISDEDLAELPPSVVGGHSAEGVRNALEAINNLRAMYSGTISYEFDQVKNPVERQWLRDAVGLRLYRQPLSPAAGRALLQRVPQVEALEPSFHPTSPGQNASPIPGTESLFPTPTHI